MVTLVIHHFEEMWSEGLRKFGTDIENECAKIMNFLENRKSEIDEVIMSFYDIHEVEAQQLEIEAFCNSEGIPFKRYEYGYGWNKDQYEFEPELISEENKGITWCDATRPYYDEDDEHILEIDGWQHNLKGKDVLLIGAFADECLDDMHTVLNVVGPQVSYVKSLCVGMDEKYEFMFNGLSREQMSTKLNLMAHEIENRINEGEDAASSMDELTEFLSDNEYYARHLFSCDWRGSNEEFFDDLMNFIDNDFDESYLSSPDEYRTQTPVYS